MKVRITFEAGDCVEPEMIGRTFENSGEKNVSVGAQTEQIYDGLYWLFFPVHLTVQTYLRCSQRVDNVAKMR